MVKTKTVSPFVFIYSSFSVFPMHSHP